MSSLPVPPATAAARAAPAALAPLAATPLAAAAQESAIA